jgi:hypothetical protein
MNDNWIDVKYRETLKLHQKIRVKFTGHEAVISKVVTTDSFGQPLYFNCYHIEPRDTNNAGGHWYFSHNFQRLK